MIEVHTRIATISAAKIIHDYVITRDGANLVEATATLGASDRNGKLQRVPDKLLNAITQ